MVTPAPSSSQRAEDVSPPRAQPPIRWPRPEAATLGFLALWAVGAILALAVPAFIVSPGVRTAPAGDVWASFACTVAGALVMLAASGLLWRRKGDGGILVMGMVPAFVAIVGGAILTASKLTGT